MTRTLAGIRTAGDITRYQAATRPDAIAFEFEGRVTSYRALDEHVNQVANGLIAAGIQRGAHIAYLERTAIFTSNCCWAARKQAPSWYRSTGV
jgi:acyl-CoA synthetase (AMP-forming)/AMP-acid ligase II